MAIELEYITDLIKRANKIDENIVDLYRKLRIRYDTEKEVLEEILNIDPEKTSITDYINTLTEAEKTLVISDSEFMQINKFKKTLMEIRGILAKTSELLGKEIEDLRKDLIELMKQIDEVNGMRGGVCGHIEIIKDGLIDAMAREIFNNMNAEIIAKMKSGTLLSKKEIIEQYLKTRGNNLTEVLEKVEERYRTSQEKIKKIIKEYLEKERKLVEEINELLVYGVTYRVVKLIAEKQ